MRFFTSFWILLIILFSTHIGWGQTFNQVTSFADLTSGEYLIVGDGTGVDGLMINSATSTPYIKYSNITNPGAIITTGFTSDNIFTITVTDVSATVKEITIHHTSVGYVSWGNTVAGTGTGNHAGFFNGTPTNNEIWTATLGSGLWILSNKATSSRILQWNQSSTAERFACYTSNQVKLKLYKKAVTDYSVTYHGNTNTSGSVPVDANSPYTPASTVTVLGNTGSLVKTGYVFGGWNTKADGTGTTYAPGSTFTINVNTDLYAIWIADGEILADDNLTGGPFNVNCGSTASGSYYFVSEGVFASGNQFVAQLSDASGNFTSPTTIGTVTLSGTDPDYDIPVTIPNTITSGTGYKVRVVSTNPAMTSNTSNPFTITNTPCSITSSISGSPISVNCSGSAVAATVTYNVTGTINTGNTYTILVSDASGSFTTPIASSTVSSTATSGTLTINIPADAVSGTGYKVRVDASNPAITGTPSSVFTISQTGNCGPCLSEEFTGWSHSYGNWTHSSNGTWTGYSVNASTNRIQMNEVGDYLELPPLDYPKSLNYTASLSAPLVGGDKIIVQYYNGTTWVDVVEHTATSQYSTVYSAIFPSSAQSNTGVRVRLYKSGYNRVHYVEDIEVFCQQPNGPEIVVEGNSVEIVSGDTSPSTTDHTSFGNVCASSGSITKTFTIRNTGNDPLEVFSITSLNATEFTVGGASLPMTVPPGSTTTFTVIFDPTSNGTKTSTIVIESNDSDEGTYTFAINGVGDNSETPSVAISASGNPVCEGTSVTFTATTSNLGGGTASYQWKVNNTNVGSNSSTFSSSTLASGDVITCELSVENGCVTINTATSNDITLTINPVATVTFNKNAASATGTMANQTACQPTNLTSNAYTNYGFTFSGWNTLVDGSGTSYSNNDLYNFHEDVTLYAQWTALTIYTVTFNGNGNDGGSMSDQSSFSPTNLTNNNFTKDGCVFRGWASSQLNADNGIVAYNDGALYNFSADITLFAVWNCNGCDLPIWEENFAYSCANEGDISLISGFSDYWSFISGTTPTLYDNTSLSYPGYESSGIGGSYKFIGGSAKDFQREIKYQDGTYPAYNNPNNPENTLFSSFLMNMDGAGTQDYFFSFRDNTATQTYYGRLNMKISGSGYVLGIQKATGTIQWSSSVLNFGETYLIVVKNQFVSGSVNDIFSIWILSGSVPVDEISAGAPTLQALTNDTDPGSTAVPQIKHIALRATGKENGRIDGIRVATSWENLFCQTNPTAPSADRYFKSIVTGNWNAVSTWLMAPSVSGPWTAACTYPTATNSDYISIENGHTVTLNLDLDADQIIVQPTGTLVLNEKLTVPNGNASTEDLLVQGTLIDNGNTSNGIAFVSGGTWKLGTQGTLVKTWSSDVLPYKDNYDGGISTIPATAHWYYRYVGNDLVLTTTEGMYYPNLYFESNAGFHAWDAAAEVLNGSTATAVVKGNLSVGKTNTGTVELFNNNSFASPILVHGNVYVGAGSVLRNTSQGGGIGTGFDIKGDSIVIEGNYVMESGTTGKTILSGSALQNIVSLTGNGQFLNAHVVLNNANDAKLNGIDMDISSTLTFIDGVIHTISSQADKVNITNSSTAAIINGQATSAQNRYINGKLQWTLANGSTYTFPVGYTKGTYGAQGFNFTVDNGSGAVLAYLEPNSTAPIHDFAYCDLAIHPSGPGIANVGAGLVGYDGILDQIEYNIHSPLQWNITNPTGGGISQYDIVVLATGLQDINPVSSPNSVAIRYLMKNGQPGNPTVPTTTAPGFTELGFEMCPNQYTLNNLTGFSMFTLDGANIGGTVLPIEVVSFTGEAVDNNAAALNWITANELNNDFFTLFYSKDGLQFEELVRIEGAGTSTQTNHYIYRHSPLSKGIHYYKLYSTDYDGTNYYRGIVAVEIDGVHAYFNSITSTIELSDKDDVQLFTTDGKLIAEGKSVNSIPINQKGVFLLHYVRSGKTEKLVIY